MTKPGPPARAVCTPEWGAGAIGGTGDDYVTFPLNGTFSGSLALQDRSGDFGTRLFDDYETWLEAGDELSVTVTRTSGTYTPRVYLARTTGCATAIAQSTQFTGANATMSYTVPSNAPGSYVLIVTSYNLNATGSYTVTATLE